MPQIKSEHRNWVRSHSDNLVDVLQRGAQFAVSFMDHDTLVVVIPALPDGSLIMGEVYRALMDEISVEFPSSFCHDTKDPLETARHAAKVHSQVVATEITYLGDFYPSPGLLDIKVHLYVADIPHPTTGTLIPGKDMLSLRAMSIQEITESIAKGGLRDAVTIACLTRYLAQSRHGDGIMPTRMLEIEILDRNNTVITTLLTNSPEWSFNAYREQNPHRPHEWKFKETLRATSPLGHPLPVKSSLSMSAAGGVSPTGAAPVFIPDMHAQEGDTSEPDLAHTEVKDGYEAAYEDVPERSSDTYDGFTNPDQEDDQADHLSHSEPLDSDEDVGPAPMFLSRRRAPGAGLQADQHTTEDHHRRHDETAQDPQAQDPQAQDPQVKDTQGFMFLARKPRPDPDVEIISQDDEEIEQTSWEAPDPAEDVPRRRLSLNVDDRPGQADEIEHVAPSQDYDQAPEEVPYASSQEVEPPRQAARAEPPVSLMNRLPRKPTTPMRKEPQLTASRDQRPYFAPEELPEVTQFEETPLSDKHSRSEGAANPKESRQLEIPSGLTRFAGFIKKTIHREPNESLDREMQLSPQMLYGVDDTFNDITPPGPAFRPAKPGWEDRES